MLKYGSLHLHIKASLLAPVAEAHNVPPRDEAPNRKILRQIIRVYLFKAYNHSNFAIMCSLVNS